MGSSLVDPYTGHVPFTGHVVTPAGMAGESVWSYQPGWLGNRSGATSRDGWGIGLELPAGMPGESVWSHQPGWLGSRSGATSRDNWGVGLEPPAEITGESIWSHTTAPLYLSRIRDVSGVYEIQYIFIAAWHNAFY